MPLSTPARRTLNALVFVVSATVAGAAILLFGARAVARFQPDRDRISADLLPRLDEVRRSMPPPRRGRKSVLLVGDSVLGLGSRPVSLAVRDAVERGGPPTLDVSTVWWPGWTVSSEYCVADDLVDFGTDRIVLEVSLRSLGAQAAFKFGYPELAGQVRASRFTEALGLPLDVAGITADRLLFYRALVTSGAGDLWARAIDFQARAFNLRATAEQGLEGLLGVRTFDDRKKAVWAFFISRFLVPGKLRERREYVLSTPWGARRGLDPSYPSLRILAAVVRRFAEAKKRPIVWIAPVNVDHLMSLGIDVRGFDRSAAAIGAVVTENGGTVLDLHAVLRDADFADAGDHATTEGRHPSSEALARYIATGILDSEGH